MEIIYSAKKTLFTIYKICLLCSSLILIVHCNLGTNNPVSEEPIKGIKIVSPKGGETFKITDTIKIIRTCNYDDIVSGLYTESSIDSGKTWQSIKATVRKSQIVTDTLLWYPLDMYLEEELLNKGLMVRVRDYNNEFIVKSGYFFLTN
jgi:hypothetical protein